MRNSSEQEVSLPEIAPSGEKAISLLAEQQSSLPILSIGVSDAGVTEIRMAQTTGRRVKAISLDEKGIQVSCQFARLAGVDLRVEFFRHDIRSGFPNIEDGTIGFVYARQSLHYLERQELQATLREIHRLLGTNGLFYMVVKSVGDRWAQDSSVTYDPTTAMTTWTYPREGNTGLTMQRQFFTPETLHSYAEGAGFHVVSIESHEEVLYWDYARTRKDGHVSSLLSMCCVKR